MKALAALLLFATLAFSQPVRWPSVQSAAQGNDILRDNFTTAAAAPIASPRSADSGYGSWIVTDTESVMPVATNRLYVWKKASAANGDPGLVSVSKYARLQGRVMMASVARTNSNTGQITIGWMTTTNGAADAAFANVNSGNVQTEFSMTSGTEYDVATVLRGYRGYIVYAKLRTSTDWTLVSVYDTVVQGTLFAGVRGNTFGGWVDNVAVQDLGGVWNVDGMWGIASNHIASPANPETITGTLSNCLATIAWKPAASEVLELSIRRTDDDNRMLMRCYQTGAVYVFKAVAAAETQLAFNTRTFAVGTEVLVGFKGISGTLRTYFNGAFFQSVTDSANSTGTGVKSSGVATNRDLTVWPLTNAMYPRPTQFASQMNVLAVGDSKSGPTGDESPWLTGFILPLNQIGNCVIGTATNMFHAGDNVSNLVTRIAGDLSSAVGTPNFIMLNVGANDSGLTFSNTIWGTNYGWLLDKLHEKWPLARIGCMTPWSTNTSVNWDQMASAITTNVNARSTFCVLGPDERVFLKGSDNGATYMGDGLHPNHAGYVLTAQEWKKIFGL